MRNEVLALVRRGCLVPWDDVRGRDGPARPRLVLSISVEPDKPRMIINAIPLKSCGRHVHFTMDTVSRVPIVAGKGLFMVGSLDHKVGFPHPRTAAGELAAFGVHSDGLDYVFTTLPFG